MVEKRKQCKDQCDKDIQKIILKDKIEKQMAQQLTTLETKIDTDDIPTCICEKSLADKVEKTCLRCGSVFGGGIAPSVGLLGGIGEAAISAWKVAALKAAARYAASKGAAEGLAAGKAAGMNVVTGVLRTRGIEQYCPEIFEQIQKIQRFTDLKNFVGAIINKHDKICAIKTSGENYMCTQFDTQLGAYVSGVNDTGPPPHTVIKNLLDFVAGKAELTANAEAADVTSKITTQLRTEQTNVINTIYGSWETTITASIIAIVVIVLILVIIYLILRYRRKKKMKKKLQYIKLLEE
ncbi:rifin [Plasmodium falciparum IGH-CR14]|nr:rifin [Plasmodium falciparum IGH-CR14]